MSARFRVIALLTGSFLLLGTASAAAEDGVGDPYYPDDGNPGYDVRHYDVGIAFDPARPANLTGDTTVTARALSTLDEFTLDLVGYRIDGVTVNGTPARAVARRGAHELVVTPAKPVRRGAIFAVRVRYSGTPTGEGWHRLTGGGVAAFGEPHAATAWYPANDHPSDKATFSLRATVPGAWSVVSNGLPGTTTTKGGQKTFRWHEDKPMATYLSVMAIDKFQTYTSALADGTPVIHAYGTGTERLPDSERQLPGILDFLASKFGPYPFSSAGGIVVSVADDGAPVALETQGKPTYSGAMFDASMVHENTHQWFGDSVSITDWRDGCLNECVAQYAYQLWEEHNGADLDTGFYQAMLDEAANDPAFWQTRLYDPGPGRELDPALYSKGSMMMHALRRYVGDDAFFGTLRTWVRDNAYGNGSWPEFEKLAARVSGVDLTGFFAAWAHGTTAPPDEYLRPGPLG